MASRQASNGRVWTLDEIAHDCAKAQELFRLRRTNEPLEDYLTEYTAAQIAADTIIDQLHEILAEPANKDLLASIVANESLFIALRYLSAPPISEDDLGTLLARRISATSLRSSQILANGLAALIRQTIDPKRFPWVEAGKAPTKAQLHTAKVASAVAATIQRVQANRRNDEKKELESSVTSLLDALGFVRTRTPRHAVQNAEDLPGPSEYMTSVTLGEDNGDCVVGLLDRRRLALECKSSNSEINSRKRLNKEAVKDAENWRRQFGNQVVSGAVLRGVFNPRYVSHAQGTPLLIFWGHRLEDLQQFIESAK